MLVVLGNRLTVELENGSPSGFLGGVAVAFLVGMLEFRPIVRTSSGEQCNENELPHFKRGAEKFEWCQE